MGDIHRSIETSTASAQTHIVTITDALNRSSHLNVGFPTRTIRITESEQNSRDNTPNPITVNDLINRPRSNPRTRTPMRYESPLESNAFRIERLTTTGSTNNDEARRVSIRPLAGSTVGTVPRGNIIVIDERRNSRSVKQGPSQRKIRKWNNEHFAGLAAEIASSSGTVAADVLIKAHRDAHLYRSIYDPKDHRRSMDVDRFMNDDEMKDAREQFFEGQGPTLPVSNNDVIKSKSSSNGNVVSGDEMMNRIEQRLRRLVIRACHNSYAAAKVVQRFESFVVKSFMNDKSIVLNEDWWTDLLLENPTMTHRKDSNRYTAQFFFHPTLPTGGFHRLLLHAVCQFHGLNVASRTEENYEYIWSNNSTTNGTRVLTATGYRLDGTCNGIRLLQHIGEAVDDTIEFTNQKKEECVWETN